MRFSMYALAAAVAAASAPSPAAAFGFSPSFASRGAAATRPSRRGRGLPRRDYQRKGDVTMYEPGSDGEDKKSKNSNIPKVVAEDSSSPSSPVVGVWSALADTERWISETLDEDGSGGKYARKSVTYVCETSDSLPHAVGAVWRRIKEARELGESHGREEELRRAREGPEAYVPRTFRQTQVVVMPNCPDIVPVLGGKDRGKGAKSFKVFDGVIKAVGRARRNARDLLTDSSLEKLDERMMGEGTRDWVVSVNVAHLHPYYEEKTPEEILAEMQEAEENGGEPEVVDVNLEAYKELRTKARRSPHPSLVLEVVASLPPDYLGGMGGAPSSMGEASPPSAEMEARAQSAAEAMGSSKRGRGRDGDEGVSSADVQRLEVLFGMGAATDRADPAAEAAEDVGEQDDADEDDAEEEDFWAALANVKGIEEISSVTPLNLARRWAVANDPLYSTDADADADSSSSSCVFLEADADVVDVDAAYEFVFLSAGGEMASMESESEAEVVAEEDNNSSEMTKRRRRRTYLALPRFLTSSATSFEKFAGEVGNIAGAVPGLYYKGKEGEGKLKDVSFFHPEHVDEERRSPVPLLVLQWK